MTRTVRSRHYAAALVGLLGTGMAGPLYAGDNLIEALKGGKVDLYLRYRFEFVEDGQPRITGTPPMLTTIPLQDAHASTLRTALGYSSGLFYDFGAYVQLEDVRVIGDDAYNNGGENGVLDHATVVDPEGTEVNQANLRYAGLPYTTLKLGRQEIEHRQAPLASLDRQHPVAAELAELRWIPGAERISAGNGYRLCLRVEHQPHLRRGQPPAGSQRLPHGQPFPTCRVFRILARKDRGLQLSPGLRERYLGGTVDADLRRALRRGV